MAQIDERFDFNGRTYLRYVTGRYYILFSIEGHKTLKYRISKQMFVNARIAKDRAWLHEK